MPTILAAVPHVVTWRIGLRLLPELTRLNNLAVVAAAGDVVAVVPPVLSPDSSAILAFGCDAEVDE